MPFTLPRKSAALAGGLVTLLSLGALTVTAQPAMAVSGNVESTATGLEGDVNLLNLGHLPITPTPVASHPAGPATAGVNNAGVAGVLSTGIVSTSASGDPVRDTSTATSTVNGLSLLGLVNTQAVSATCTSDGTSATGSTSVLNATVSGGVSIPANPAPNTVVNVTVLDGILPVTIAKLTLNEQTTTSAGNGYYSLHVNALHLKLLGVPLIGVGVGDVIVGEAECASRIPVAPSLSSVSPVSGPTGGGTTLTVAGLNMLAVTSVTIDGASVPFTPVSETQLTVSTPAHVAGPVTVRVTNPAGTATLANAFTYRNAPAVTGLSPAAGVTAGGNTVTITGTGFDDITGVNFGGTPATGWTRISSTRIDAVAPAGSGTADVSVVGAGGTSANSSADNYTYVAAPTLSSISPAYGRTTGGDQVTLTGTNFTPGSTVTVDGVQVTPTAQTSTSLTVTMPAHASGSAPVIVTTAGGSTAPQSFSYLVYPVVASITPMWGTDAGGTLVTVSGTGLGGVTGVTIGAGSGTILSQTPTSLTFSTPAQAAGAVNVTLTGPGSASVDAGTYTFVTPAPPSAPTVTALSPSHAATGSLITVTGTGFTSSTGVSFGGTAATSVVVLSPTTLMAGVPAGTGVVPVQVTTVDGTSTPGAASTFTYPPVLTSISPDNGPVAGGTVVTVNGSGFTPTTVVLIDGVPVAPTYVSPTQLTVVLPAHAAGDVTVAVQLNGVSSGTTTVRYLAATTPSASTSPTSSPTTSPTSSPSSTATTSPTGTATSTATSTSTSTSTNTATSTASTRPTQDGSADPTGTDDESGNVDTTDSAGNDGASVNGNNGGGIFSGSGAGNGSPRSTSTSAAGSGSSNSTPNAPQAADGGVTSDAETGVFSSALHNKLGWGLFLLLLAALATGWALLGGAWRRRQDARRLADALEKYWAGMGPVVESEAVGVIRIPRLGEDWRWPVYQVTSPAVLDHGVGLRSGEVLSTNPGDVEMAALASSPFHPLPHLPQVMAGDAITLITPERIFTYRATGTGTGGALPSWGPPADEGSKFTLSSCGAGGANDATDGTTVRAILERINHRTMNSEAPAEAVGAE